MKIVVFCTGNTCRSPMAAALLIHTLRESGISGVDVLSAGLYAVDGMPATNEAIRVMAECGLDISGHQAHRLTEDIVTNACLFGMTQAHVHAAREMFSDAEIQLFSEYAGENVEVGDPYGGTLDMYRRCAELLKKISGKAACRLAGKTKDRIGRK